MAASRFAFGFALDDFYDRAGLVRLDALFCAHLEACDAKLFNRVMAARAMPDALRPKENSALLVELAPPVEGFIGQLFQITPALVALGDRHHALGPIYRMKRLFVQRHAARAVPQAVAQTLDGAELTLQVTAMIGEAGDDPVDFERRFACQTEALVGKDMHIPEGDLRVETLVNYAAWALYTQAGRARHAAGLLFQQPARLDMEHLVPVATEEIDGVRRMALAPWHARRQRAGFALTDAGCQLAGALDQAHYCIWCHNQDKDSCAKGFREKTGGFRKNHFGVPQVGCPLEEKISEMNWLKAAGHAIGALAVAVVDNPMVAATGHRICNDCMKACIYQKQQPVDIPQIETRTLKDVLDLPFGFEIYSLLTRWNPLNWQRPVPRPASGRTVLVVGLGPAGFTLAHHLMNDGHHVVAIDGLKIEPLAATLSGIDMQGKRQPFAAIEDSAQLREPLDERLMAGFGGVAEYGITVRWDKNFLKIIRLLLERRRAFTMYGGVRFGGALSVEQAFDLGFDHIALCMGAGRPTVLTLPHGLARGVRQASDFLMALQLTGAARAESLANLQIQLPVVVIGGGLTAIDTTTEALAYYPVQVEKFLSRFERLAALSGEALVRARWNAEESAIADRFLAHAKALRAARQAALAEGVEPDIAGLLRQWGGATLVYRRKLVEAPSYTLNHEEIEKALEEGIEIVEQATPVAVEPDEWGAAAALSVMVGGADARRTVRLAARSILVAAGTQPNTVLAREEPGAVALDGRFFQAIDEQGAVVSPQRLAKPAAVHVLTHRRPDGRFMSFFGDLHPSFAGNVVKAMASAKQGYPVVSRALAQTPPQLASPQTLIQHLDEGLRATVERVVRLTPTIIELVVRAPMAARAFQPGQFYRLQNYEALASSSQGGHLVSARFGMEGLALTGASADREAGLLSLIVLEMGGSSDLCRLLQPGEPVVLMGPTGTATEIPQNETVLLVGGGLGNAVLFSIGQALRQAGCRVVYFAGYKKIEDRYKTEQIEQAADIVVWCCDEAPGFTPSRPQDLSHTGTIVAAMAAYAQGTLGHAPIALRDCQRMIVIGSDGMMATVTAARHQQLAAHLSPGHAAIGSINSPMQCMMKEICAQCLQRHVDPATGLETVVFSCANQDQPLDLVDWRCLNDRLRQNSVQEKLTRSWIAQLLPA